jgi:hypothetical protein
MEAKIPVWGSKELGWVSAVRARQRSRNSLARNIQSDSANPGDSLCREGHAMPVDSTVINAIYTYRMAEMSQKVLERNCDVELAKNLKSFVGHSIFYRRRTVETYERNQRH